MRSVIGMAACIVLLLPLSVHSGEVGYLPGGADVRRAVEARRGVTELSKLAASMAPGTWAELKTDMPRDLWSAPPPGRGLHIGTWSDDAHWCSRTGQFLFFGVRRTRKFVAYSEKRNAWSVIDFVGKENAPELEQRFGHQYSANAFDPERSLFYTNGRAYDVVADTWTQLPAWRRQENEKSMVISYSAMDGLLVLIHQPKGVLRILRHGETSWSDAGRIAVHGYHSLARYNPFRQEVLFVGGNDSRAVVVVDKNGTARTMKPFPEPITIRFGVVTVDPKSGRYLMKGTTQRLYEFDSAQDRYRLLYDLKDPSLPLPDRFAARVAFIPEYGVTMWADTKVFLYKHNPYAEYPVVPSTAENPETR